MLAVLLHRLSHCLYANEWRRCAVLLARANTVLHGVILAPESCIGPALLLPHPTGVTFFGTAGRELTLYSMAVCSTYAPGTDGGAPRLGNRVTVGAHAAIMGPVSVGDDVKIAYSLRVVRDIPPSVMVVSSALRVKFRPAAGHPRELI
jgi:serine O-acetyltransferase